MTGEIIKTKNEYDREERITTSIYVYDTGDIYEYKMEYYKNSRIPAKEFGYKNGKWYKTVHFDEKGRVVLFEENDNCYTIYTYNENEYNPNHEFHFIDNTLIHHEAAA